MALTNGAQVKIELRDIHKTFGGKGAEESVSVLENIAFQVREKRFVSIVGPSGCGKTTLLKIMAGLQRPSRGQVLLDGKEIALAADPMGMVFQEYGLFPWRTALGNIVFGLEVMGVPKRERRAAAMDYVKAFGLGGFENQYPGELSGGMQQRVAIARTLIVNPAVVLMDEPFGSLDSQTRNNLQEFLLDVWQTRGETIVFVTHNIDEAVFLSDKIIVLSNRPATLSGRFDVGLSRPRDRTSPECNDIRRAVLEMLREQG